MIRTMAWRAAAAGTLSITVLSGMLVRHAWPLWTGETIHLLVRPIDPRDLFRGDYVILGYDIQTLTLNLPADAGAPPAPIPVPIDPNVPPPPQNPIVEPVGDWWREERTWRRWQDLRLYVQLRPEPADAAAGVPSRYVPVSLADHPVEGAINLEGRVQYFSQPLVQLRFGLDAFYVREDTGRPIEDALRRRAPVYAEIAVTRAGRARVRALIVDGTRVE
jgi:uncharacterized membrane-anchored protein